MLFTAGVLPIRTACSTAAWATLCCVLCALPAFGRESTAPRTVLLFVNIRSAPDMADAVDAIRATLPPHPPLEVRWTDIDFGDPRAARDQIIAETSEQDMPVAIWFTVDGDIRLHLYAAGKGKDPNRFRSRTIQPAGTDIHVEAVAAVLQNWLSALPDQEADDKQHTAEGWRRQIADDESPFTPQPIEKKDNRILRFHRFSFETGYQGQALSRSHPVVSGVWLAGTVQLKPWLALAVAYTAIPPVVEERTDASLRMERRPVSAGIRLCRDRNRLLFAGHLLFEVDTYSRQTTQHSTDQEISVGDRTLRAQFSAAAGASIGFRINDPLSLFLAVTGRFIFNPRNYTVRINGEEVLLHRPFGIQPVLQAGLRIGL